MAGFVLRRLAVSVVLLGLVLSATFLIVQLAPGHPVDILFSDRRVSPELRAATIERLGLDGSVGVQYVRWMTSMARLDWGHSFAGDMRPAKDIVLEAMPATAALALGVVIVQLGLGIFLGLLAALRRATWIDQAIRVVTLLLFALPTFYLGNLLIEVFSVRLGWAPSGGMRGDDPPGGFLAGIAEVARYAALPSLVVGLSFCGRVVRLVRAGLLEVLEQDYIRAAYARGLSRTRVILRHALPNAIGPVIQYLGFYIPSLLSGIVVIEVVFAWPGLGRVAVAAYGQRDLPVILAATTLGGALAIFGSLAADLVHAMIDPRVRDAQRS